MKQSILTKYVVAFVICLSATNCSKHDSTSQEQLTEGFKALVMGGKDIDPNQTWSTASSASVNVSVNMQGSSQYTVYIYQTHPATSSKIAYLGMAIFSPGETKTITVAKPNDALQLYAACYDAQSRVVCMPVTNGQVTFSGTITSSTGVPTITTGNNWSVPYQATPDVSKYTSEPLTEVSDLDPDLPADAEARAKISQTYSGFIPFLTSHTNMSVYVTSTWTLTFDQRLNSGNVIVVGNGGKIVIPKGFTLTTAPLGDGSSSGRIYVLPGGEISGQGTVEFSSEADFNYIAGTVATDEIIVSNGTLYNAGTIGNSSSTASLAGASTASTPAQFINLGTAYLSSVDGTNLTIMNAGTIRVTDDLKMTESARMDDNSTLTCGSLTLQGNGSSTLYMGNGAHLHCNYSVTVNNYGVWGPSGSKYTANARFRLGGCSNCSATSGNAGDYLLDHVQVEVPTGATGLDLLYTWMNATQTSIEESRQTCFYLLEGTHSKPNSNYVYYAFEIPDNYGVRDYDYNDVILRVNTPYDNGDGTYTISVNVAAIGSDLELTVLYNGETLGKEIHEAMGVGKSVKVNTSSYTRDPQVLGMITVSDPNIAIDKLPFSISRKSSSGSTSTLTQSTSREDAPLYMAISGSPLGKWWWPKEGSNIGLAYKFFSDWAANVNTYPDWYDYTKEGYIGTDRLIKTD
jgi:hypothetical protein